MIWRYSCYIAIIALSVFFGFIIAKKTKSVPAGLLLAWVLGSAGHVLFNPEIFITAMDLRLKLVAGRSFALTSMMVLLVSCMNMHGAVWGMRGLIFLSVVNCALILGLGYGMFNAHTMDATFIALLLPLNIGLAFTSPLKPLNFILAGIPLLTMFMANVGSTVFFVLALQLGAFLLMVGSWRWLVPAVIVILGYGYMREGANLYTSPDRVDEWIKIMGWWWSNANIWVGTGSGTFMWLGPAIQNRADNLFTWMHNDWLQIIFEQGIIGITLTMWLLMECLYKARNRPWLVSSIAGVCFAMVTQFPLRFPLTILFVLLLIHASLFGDDS